MNLQTTSTPWCDQCGSYHHTSAPHISPRGVREPIESGFDDPDAKLPPPTAREHLNFWYDETRPARHVYKFAIDLAKRADEAEAKAVEQGRNAVELFDECKKLRAQLTGEQKLREMLNLYKESAAQLELQLSAVQSKLAALFTPSDAPTPETDALSSNGKAHYMALDHARRLERERDEARAELAKLKTNNRYQRGFHDGEQAARDEKHSCTPLYASV